MNKYIAGLQVIIILLLFCCCTEDMRNKENESLNKPKTVLFNIQSLTASVEEEPLSRSVITNSINIKQVWCVVQDAKGSAIRSFHLYGDKTAKLYLEGVEPGNYTAFFMATTEDIPVDTTVPDDITNPWINHSESGRPFEKDYLYKKVDFTVNTGQVNQTLNVKLPRLTGRAEVRINFSNPQLEQLIEKVEIVFDAEAKVSSFMLGNGTYGGENLLHPIDVTQDKGFFSLPGKKLSGEVQITHKIEFDKTETAIKKYRFDNFDIEPGFISLIQIDFSHIAESDGVIKVKESSYTIENSSTMFMDSEPASVIVTRKFKAKELLEVGIDTANKKLVTRLFSPLELLDTKVWIKFKRYSNKFFLLAEYDIIHPFQESKMDIPVMSARCKFKSEDGEQKWVPAQEDLSSSNCELKVTYSDTPFMRKIQSMKCNWTIGFDEKTTDPNVTWKVLDMTPEIARHCCALGINLAYMFSSDLFQKELENSELHDDARRPIDTTELMNKLYTKELKLGILFDTLEIGGKAERGGHRMAIWKEFYHTIPYADYQFTQGREIFFHELGHILGYGHESNMTSGGNARWPALCTIVLTELSARAELPILDEEIVTSLPR